MASRFLRADFRRACRPSRPQSNSSSALFFADSREQRSAAPTSRTLSGRVVAGLASPGWHCTSASQSLGHACRELSVSSRGVTNTTSSESSSTTSRFGSVNRVRSSASCISTNPCWRGAGGMVLCSTQSQAGRRYLSSRRGKAGSQTLTNRSIRAKELLLVLETKDGSKETTVVTRQQALDAAEAANLDLVQVSGKGNPVVCRLMDFKRDEYRRQKMKKTNAKRAQKKKEIRLRGMIASHDFERKVKDVKKYLDRGDIVRVVLEANTSLLKRSGNCLNELQENFEAEMEALEGVVMKRSGGGNGYTRREIECIPKTIKATSTKATKSAPSPAKGEGGGEAGASTPPRPPPLTRVVDEEIVREILTGTVSASTSTAANQGERQGEENVTPSSSSSDSEESSGEKSSGEEWEEDSSDDDKLLFDADVGSSKEQEDEMLKLGSIVIPVRDVEYYGEITEEASKADEMEWERHQARQREARRKNREANRRSGDGHARRGGATGGGGGRRKWRAALGDMRGDLVGEPADMSGDLVGETADVDDDIRRRPRSPRSSPSSPRKSGQEGAASLRRANNAAGPGGGEGAGGFAGRERPGGIPSSTIRGPQQAGFARGRGGGGGGGQRGGVNGSLMDGKRSEGARGGRGAGGGGRGLAPPAAPPIRTTPYKWRTSLADQAGATKRASVQQQQQQQQGLPLDRRGTGSPSGVGAAWATSSPAAAASQDGGLGASGAAANASADDSGQIRGFRDRFGGGVAGRPSDAEAGADSDSS